MGRLECQGLLKVERWSDAAVTSTRVRDEEQTQRVEQLADRLHSAAIHLLRRVRRQDEVSGVGPAQLSALSVLVFGGPSTLGGLAAAEMVRPPTMSRIVAGLTKSGLAESVTDESDARRL